MKILVDKKSKIIIALGQTSETAVNGILLDKDLPSACIYPMIDELDVFEVAIIPTEVKPQEYCYTATQGFYNNPNYVPYVSIDQQVKDLQAQNAQMLLALVEGGLM